MHATQCNDTYAITPIRTDFLHRARNEGLDDQHQPVERHTAQGGEPLRDVLRRARPGERIILASYCPFTVAGPYKEFGPVFILAHADAAEDMPDDLPLGTYFNRPFILRAYSVQERIVHAVLTSTEEAELTLRELLNREDVSFVLARFAAYGCYACRIERHASTAPDYFAISTSVPRPHTS